MNKVLIFAVLLISFQKTFGQNAIEIDAGYYTYNMSDMKAMQNASLEDIEITSDIVSSFPAFVGFGVQVFIKKVYLSEWTFNQGVRLDYTSTGGRIGYQDYSGKFSLDQLVNRFGFGYLGRFMKSSEKKYKTGAEFLIQYSHSTFDYEYNLSLVGTSSVIDNYVFNSGSFQINLSWVNNYDITTNLYLQSRIGYELDVWSGPLNYSKNNGYLLNSDGSKTRLNWSGVRINFGLGFKL